MEVDAERSQSLPAKSGIGWISFRGADQAAGMMQGEKKLSPAGVHIQNPGRWKKTAAKRGFVVPGEVLLLLIAAMDMREVPAQHVSCLFLRQPLG